MTVKEATRLAKMKKRKGYKCLHDYFAKDMFTVSYRITNNREISKDVLQESFLKAFSQLGQLQNEVSFGSWLKRIVINQSLQIMKKEMVFSELNDLMIMEEVEKDWFTHNSILDLRDKIQELPVGCRTIFSLYAIEGLKHREIAENLSIHISTSKSQYAYACKLLRMKLINNVAYED